MLIFLTITRQVVELPIDLTTLNYMQEYGLLIAENKRHVVQTILDAFEVPQAYSTYANIPRSHS